MKKPHSIQNIAVLLGAAMLFAACGKDNTNLIIGSWENTEQSYEMTIAGTNTIPVGTIWMEFTADSVMVADLRCNCLPRWEHYTLTTKDGKRILHVENSFLGDCVVEGLTRNKMVLTSDDGPDMGFQYTLKRHTASTQPY